MEALHDAEAKVIRHRPTCSQETTVGGMILIVVLLVIWAVVFRPTMKRGLLRRLYDEPGNRRDGGRRWREYDER